MRRAKSYSRYRRAFEVPGDRGVWLSPSKVIVDTSPRQDDTFHTVVDGDRLDLLAHRYFGDARLWWVIAEYNDLTWMLDLTTGTELRLPSYEHLNMDLLV